MHDIGNKQCNFFFREMLVLRVLLVSLVHMAHQDLREALDSLGSKVKG